jgi:hypothetical protein
MISQRCAEALMKVAGGQTVLGRTHRTCGEEIRRAPAERMTARQPNGSGSHAPFQGACASVEFSGGCDRGLPTGYLHSHLRCGAGLSAAAIFNAPDKVADLRLRDSPAHACFAL